MADCADAITLAIEKSFTCRRLTCWAHVDRAYEPRFNLIEDAGIKKQLFTDLNKLQLSFSDLNFNANWFMFYKKWGDHKDMRVSDFISHLKKEFVESKTCFWYEGAALGYPSTNNALESTNNSIKNKHTLRLRENLSHFLSNLVTMIETWTFDRMDPVDSIKKFYDLPQITADNWREVDEYIKNEPRIKFLSDFGIYLVANSDTTDLMFGELYDLIECENNECKCYYEIYSFDEYTNLNSQILRVQLKKDRWQLSNCTCKSYLKEYICVHIITVAVKKKLTKIDYSFNPIGCNPKRGRKPKSGSWNQK